MCIIMMLLCVLVGCLLYAKYSDCDPLVARSILKLDLVNRLKKVLDEYEVWVRSCMRYL